MLLGSCSSQTRDPTTSQARDPTTSQNNRHKQRDATHHMRGVKMPRACRAALELTPRGDVRQGGAQVGRNEPRAVVHHLATTSPGKASKPSSAYHVVIQHHRELTAFNEQPRSARHVATHIAPPTHQSYVRGAQEGAIPSHPHDPVTLQAVCQTAHHHHSCTSPRPCVFAGGLPNRASSPLLHITTTRI